MIAGDENECELDTDDLAALAMMSSGKASQARAFWLATGLLIGQKKPTDRGQFRWSLRVPDVWPANVAWRQDNNRLKGPGGRIDQKRQQRAGVKADRATDVSITDHNHDPNWLPETEEQMPVLFAGSLAGIKGYSDDLLARMQQNLERTSWRLRSTDLRNAVILLTAATNWDLPVGADRKSWAVAIGNHLEKWSVQQLSVLYPEAYHRLLKSREDAERRGSTLILAPSPHTLTKTMSAIHEEKKRARREKPLFEVVGKED
jgi:hypothetical protein